jgi:hypothetical protein
MWSFKDEVTGMGNAFRVLAGVLAPQNENTWTV